MKRQITEPDNTYFSHMIDVMRVATVFILLVAIGGGFLVKMNLLDMRFYGGDTVFYLLISLLSIVALTQWVNISTNRTIQMCVHGLLHVLVALFLLYISGIYSPFIILWIPLFIATNMYFGTKGAIISIASLASTYLLGVMVWPIRDVQTDVATLLVVFFVMILCYIVSRIEQLAHMERTAFTRSKRSELFQKERLETLLNAMGDAVINTDEKGVIHVYNAAALNLLDTNASLGGQSIDRILKLRDEKGKRTHLSKLLKDSHRLVTVRRDLSHYYSSTDHVNLYINIAPIHPSYEQSEIERGYIIILRDITKEKTLEEERDEFISVVSHELRTPIAIMEGNISNVQLIMNMNETTGKTAPETLSRALNAAHDQSLYLAKMVNDLSTLSRAERGVGDEAETIDVRELLEDAYNEYQASAADKHLALNLDISPKLPTLHTSRLYLEEMLQNFITNAIKYTEKGEVLISAHATKQGGVTFAVKDSGIGISKSDQGKIFDKFYRSEDYRTRETSGTGLGLYVVQKLSQKLGTRVEVQSTLNHGSTFSFTIRS